MGMTDKSMGVKGKAKTKLVKSMPLAGGGAKGGGKAGSGSPSPGMSGVPKAPGAHADKRAHRS